MGTGGRHGNGREAWEGDGGVGGGRIEELSFHARDQERLFL